ncbi:hydroxypyruvate isomerase family protein [Bordetella petrii]|uniref:hydroxypyruvate isomerase family protein n=1 Tax=Bordetella petrii TaxID=94624 RepID=UPI001E4CB01F|nr:TIM barrel protein [Bordetella petrii]MCD0505165.1 TIM barrel protein [Bordetella petrii]
MKLAANLSLLYPGLPLAQRMAAAARDGFAGAEILFPYDLAPAELAAMLRDHGLELVLVNTPPGAAGEKGLACLPGREADFGAALQRALQVCDATGCRMIHTMAGVPPAGTVPSASRATLIGNLRSAARPAQQAGVTLTLEALNRADVPGYFYHRPDQAADIINTVGHDTIGLQFDLYHTQRENLDLHAALQSVLPLVRHVQFACADGRHEPDPADPAVAGALRTLANHGYAGWVGCEYIPRGDTSTGLAWRQAYQAVLDNRGTP